MTGESPPGLRTPTAVGGYQDPTHGVAFGAFAVFGAPFFFDVPDPRLSSESRGLCLFALPVLLDGRHLSPEKNGASEEECRTGGMTALDSGKAGPNPVSAPVGPAVRTDIEAHAADGLF